MIILDTNFLIYLAKYRLIHLLDDVRSQLAVPDAVIEELEMLSIKAGKIKDREAAKLALSIIEKWNIKLLECGGNADSAILLLAEKNRAKVATMDKILSESLRKRGIFVIKLRQKKRLIMCQ